MPTFQDLGLLFPLFQADISEAAIEANGRCEVCGQGAQFLFASACYACFRAGIDSYVVDTELGMVTVEDAAQGRTHGLPLSSRADLPGWVLVPHADAAASDPQQEEQWYHVCVDSQHLLELLRTPKYITWQGERWLFCCKRPSVFLGPLEAGMSCQELVEMLEVTSDEAAELEPGISSGAVCTYAFQCPTCGRRRAHYDMG